MKMLVTTGFIIYHISYILREFKTLLYPTKVFIVLHINVDDFFFKHVESNLGSEDGVGFVAL